MHAPCNLLLADAKEHHNHHQQADADFHPGRSDMNGSKLKTETTSSLNGPLGFTKPPIPPTLLGLTSMRQTVAVETTEISTAVSKLSLDFQVQPRSSRKPRTLNILQHNATCGPAFGRSLSPQIVPASGSNNNNDAVVARTDLDAENYTNGFEAREFRDSYRLVRRRKLELTRSQLPESLHASFLPNDDRIILEELQDEEKLREIIKQTGILTIRGTLYVATIDDLEHVGEVGHGVCGTVVKMRFKKTGDVIAVKQMRRSGNREENKRILRDLEVILKSNDCPHIVQCYGCFVLESEVWICMELMTSCMEKLLHRTRRILQVDDDSCRLLDADNGSSRRYTTRVGGIPEPIIGTMSLSVVKALHYLKEKHGVIHRDVKPSNILVDARTGRFKLCDFGISGRLVDSKAKTRTAGCAAYMAPERISPPDPKKPDYDIRADVWSFGISLYELATGSMPYKNCQGDFEVLTKIIEEDPPILSPDDGFSIPFCSFLQACLTKDHKHRPKYHELLQHPFIRLYELKKIDIFDFLRSVTTNTQFLYLQHEMLLKPSVQQQSPTVTPQLPCMPLYHQRLNNNNRPVFSTTDAAAMSLSPPALPPKMKPLAGNNRIGAPPPRSPLTATTTATATVVPRWPVTIVMTNDSPAAALAASTPASSSTPQSASSTTPSTILPTTSVVVAVQQQPPPLSLRHGTKNFTSAFSPSNIYELVRQRLGNSRQQQQQQPQPQSQQPAIYSQHATSYYDWLQQAATDDYREQQQQQQQQQKPVVVHYIPPSSTSSSPAIMPYYCRNNNNSSTPNRTNNTANTLRSSSASRASGYDTYNSNTYDYYRNQNDFYKSQQHNTNTNILSAADMQRRHRSSSNRRQQQQQHQYYTGYPPVPPTSHSQHSHRRRPPPPGATSSASSTVMNSQSLRSSNNNNRYFTGQYSDDVDNF